MGKGVVYWQTAIIGNHVRLYQGVDIGCKKALPWTKEKGLPLDVPRHPIIEKGIMLQSIPLSLYFREDHYCVTAP